MSGALVMLICSLLLQPCAIAQPGNRSPQAQESEPEDTSVQSETTIDSRKASEVASSRHKGRVINIRLEKGVWRVRMDNEGTVFDVFVNASTGEVSRSE
jgi:uncharacterized membrane protein YkoI